MEGIALSSQGLPHLTLRILSPRKLAPPVFAKGKTKGLADANSIGGASGTTGGASCGSQLSAHWGISKSSFGVQTWEVSHFMPPKNVADRL